MACKEICHKHKAVKPFGVNDRYGIGQKRCSTCEMFIKWGGTYCPCCGSMLRTKPKGTQQRQRLMVIQQIQRI